MIDLSVPNRSLAWDYVSFVIIAATAIVASIVLFSFLVASNEPAGLNLL